MHERRLDKKGRDMSEITKARDTGVREENDETNSRESFEKTFRPRIERSKER